MKPSAFKRDGDVLTGTEYVYGNFSPSVAPDIVFVALFFIAALVICIQIGRNRRETLNPIGVCFLFLGTPLLQFAGYTIRIPSVLSPSSSGLYLANMILIGLGPLYCSITNLLVFAALVTYAGLQYSPWKPWVIVSQTIVWHIQCIQLQARGLSQAYNYTEDLDYRNTGSGVMLGGLGLNLGLWIIYAIILAKFMKRFFRERSSDADTLAKRVRAISAVLIINIVTFIIRTVYRIVEFSILIRTGVKTDEIWLYVFDATPMFIGVMAFALVLPYDLPYGHTFKLMSRRKRERYLLAAGEGQVSGNESTPTLTPSLPESKKGAEVESF